jgi:AraC-like DNA-binding protein
MKLNKVTCGFIPSYEGSPHIHPDEYEFHYMLLGRGSFVNGSKSYRLTNGSIFLSPPRLEHVLTIERGKQNGFFCFILFEPEHPDECKLMGLITRRFERDGFLRIGPDNRFYFEDMKRKIASQNNLMGASASHQFLSFLYALAGDETISYTGLGNRYIEEALKLMQERIYAQLDADTLAQRLGLSNSYFNRLFKQKLGLPPFKYFQKLKIETACFLLKATDKPVRSIASQLSFFDEFHFSRTFKKVVGVSPRDYRSQ